MDAEASRVAASVRRREWITDTLGFLESSVGAVSVLLPQPKVLTIVIPALNEEGAIGRTITRCLEARVSIMREAGLDGVEIIVVSDGSTDRTVEIAQGFEPIKVIVFEKNRGYGAAIMEGFRHGAGASGRLSGRRRHMRSPLLRRDVPCCRR